MPVCEHINGGRKWTCVACSFGAKIITITWQAKDVEHSCPAKSNFSSSSCVRGGGGEDKIDRELLLLD